MARAYAYIRMSTDAQLKGDSLQRQLALAEQYALNNGLVLDKLELHDKGVSAYDGANLQKGALGKFLKLVRDGDIPSGSYFLVESFDRISRKDPREAHPLFTELQKHGITIVTTTDGKVFSPNNEALPDLIWSLVVFSRANEESVQKSKRLKSAWASKRKKIEDQKLTARCPAWLRLNMTRDEFEQIPERVKIVKRIFEECLSGIGADKIARRLNKEGIKPFRSSNGWQKSTVQKILKSPAVYGEFQPMTLSEKKRFPVGEVQPHYFPKIIDEDTFWTAQGSISGRRNGGGGRKGTHVSNLFSGLLKCGYCGAKVHFLNKGKKGGQQLICDNTRRNLGCESETWNYQEFETSFLAFVRELKLEEITDSSSTKDRLREIDNSISAIEAKLENLRDRQEKTYEMLMKSDTPNATLQRRYQDIDHEMIELSDQKQSLQNEKIIESANAQSASDDVLKSAIETLQNTGTTDSFKLRSIVASQIRNFVGEILIESFGSIGNDIHWLRRPPPLSLLKTNYKQERRFHVLFKHNSVVRTIQPTANNPLEATSIDEI